MINIEVVYGYYDASKEIKLPNLKIIKTLPKL